MSNFIQQEKVYKSAFRSFFPLCVRYCGDQDKAKEVFNDAMFKFFRYEKKNTVDEKGKYSLIKKIIVNQCIDHVRNKKIEFVNIEEQFSVEYNDYNSAEYNMIRQEMMKLIQTFAPQTRLIFNLYIFEGWSHKEIAQELNISIHTSNWHVNAGKKKILSLFELEKKYGK